MYSHSFVIIFPVILSIGVLNLSVFLSMLISFWFFVVFEYSVSSDIDLTVLEISSICISSSLSLSPSFNFSSSHLFVRCSSSSLLPTPPISWFTLSHNVKKFCGFALPALVTRDKYRFPSRFPFRCTKARFHLSACSSSCVSSLIFV